MQRNARVIIKNKPADFQSLQQLIQQFLAEARIKISDQIASGQFEIVSDGIAETNSTYFKPISTISGNPVKGLHYILSPNVEAVEALHDLLTNKTLYFTATEKLIECLTYYDALFHLLYHFHGVHAKIGLNASFMYSTPLVLSEHFYHEPVDKNVLRNAKYDGQSELISFPFSDINETFLFEADYYVDQNIVINPIRYLFDVENDLFHYQLIDFALHNPLLLSRVMHAGFRMWITGSDRDRIDGQIALSHEHEYEDFVKKVKTQITKFNNDSFKSTNDQATLLLYSLNLTCLLYCQTMAWFGEDKEKNLQARHSILNQLYSLLEASKVNKQKETLRFYLKVFTDLYSEMFKKKLFLVFNADKNMPIAEKCMANVGKYAVAAAEMYWESGDHDYARNQMLAAARYYDMGYIFYSHRLGKEKIEAIQMLDNQDAAVRKAKVWSRAGTYFKSKVVKRSFQPLSPLDFDQKVMMRDIIYQAKTADEKTLKALIVNFELEADQKIDKQRKANSFLHIDELNVENINEVLCAKLPNESMPAWEDWLENRKPKNIGWTNVVHIMPFVNDKNQCEANLTYIIDCVPIKTTANGDCTLNPSDLLEQLLINPVIVLVVDDHVLKSLKQYYVFLKLWQHYYGRFGAVVFDCMFKEYSHMVINRADEHVTPFRKITALDYNLGDKEQIKRCITKPSDAKLVLLNDSLKLINPLSYFLHAPNKEGQIKFNLLRIKFMLLNPRLAGKFIRVYLNLYRLGQDDMLASAENYNTIIQKKINDPHFLNDLIKIITQPDMFESPLSYLEKSFKSMKPDPGHVQAIADLEHASIELYQLYQMSPVDTKVNQYFEMAQLLENISILQIRLGFIQVASACADEKVEILPLLELVTHIQIYLRDYDGLNHEDYDDELTLPIDKDVKLKAGYLMLYYLKKNPPAIGENNKILICEQALVHLNAHFQAVRAKTGISSSEAAAIFEQIQYLCAQLASLCNVRQVFKHLNAYYFMQEAWKIEVARYIDHLLSVKEKVLDDQADAVIQDSSPTTLAALDLSLPVVEQKRKAWAMQKIENLNCYPFWRAHWEAPASQSTQPPISGLNARNV